MKAILLAAGQGTRLRPYTNNLPKAKVSLFGRPLIDRQIDVLRACGIEDIAIVTGYHAEKLSGIGRQFHNDKFGTSNMVTSLFCADSFMDNSADVIISYTDIVYSERVMQKLIDAENEFCVVADQDWLGYWQFRMENPLDDVESFKVSDTTGQILELGKKVESYRDVQGQYIGLFKIRSERVNKVKEAYYQLDKDADFDGRDFDNMYMTSFLQTLIQQGQRLSPVYINRGWLEVDTVADLDLYHSLSSFEEALQVVKP